MVTLHSNKTLNKIAGEYQKIIKNQFENQSQKIE